MPCAGLRSCISYAISKRFSGTITLNPRLDQVRIAAQLKVRARSPRPGSTKPAALLQWPGHGGLWRAYLPLDPLANHGAHSYWSSVLRPLATIAQELAPKAAR
jgi:hypothetical protein